jgi:general L-amino acid transport system substrate-binding protein
MAKSSASPSIQRLLGTSGDLGSRLGLDNKWLLQALKAGGNYGEIFERNVGQASPLKLARGLNATWSKGGLLHPFRSNSRLCKGSTAARGPAPPGTVAARS